MKTEKVTRAKLNKEDSYRAQVQLDKWVWAFCYGPISDRNPQVAGELRDALGEAVAKIVVDRFRILMTEPSFRAFQEQWFQVQVDPELQPQARAWLEKLLNGGTPHEAVLSGQSSLPF